MTPEQLKYSILKYAFSGKLVDLDFTDSLPKVKSVSLDENLFDIPDTWMWSSLGNCCEMYTGNSISESVKKAKYTGISEGLDYIATKDVTFENTIVYDNGVRIPVGEDFRIAKAGAVLMCIEGGSAGRKIGIVDRDVCFGNKLCMFNSEVIENKYIYFYLQSNEFKRFFSGNLSGIIGGVSIKKLKELPIPIPSIEEQRHIVARIEQLLPYVDRYAASYEKLELFNAKFPEDMKKSILQYAIQGKLVEQRLEEGTAEDLYKAIQEEKQKLIKEGTIKKEKSLADIEEEEIPFDIPESWKWVRFGDIATFLNGDRGKNYPNKSEYVDEGVAWINTGHITPDGYLTTENMNFITEEKFSLISNGHIIPGDFVYCLRGATFGKVARVEPYDRGAIASSLMIIRLVNLELREYIYWYLKSPNAMRELRKYDNGSAQPNLAAKDVAKYLIPLPPLDEQKRIVELIEQLLPICERLK